MGSLQIEEFATRQHFSQPGQSMSHWHPLDPGCEPFVAGQDPGFTLSPPLPLKASLKRRKVCFVTFLHSMALDQSTLTWGAVVPDLNVAVAAAGLLLGHCLVLGLIAQPVFCDCARLPEQPPTTRLGHTERHLLHCQKSHCPRFILNT